MLPAIAGVPNYDKLLLLKKNPHFVCLKFGYIYIYIYILAENLENSVYHMSEDVQVCPHCGNYVKATKVKSYANKVARQGTKSAVHMATSAGGAATGAAVGSAILPGIGTVVGGAIGFVGSAMFNQAVNEGIDNVADHVTDFELHFECPKCGHTWNNSSSSEEGDFNSSPVTYGYTITDNCVACGTCIGECPVGAISEGDIYSINHDQCCDCGTCASVCPTEAITHITD